jgi:hypothetical protein
MRTPLTVTLLVVSGWAATATADPWKDGSGGGRWGGGYESGEDGSRERGYVYYGSGRKEEYWSAGCKFEQKWNGKEYEEERKCRRGWSLGAWGRFQ